MSSLGRCLTVAVGLALTSGLLGSGPPTLITYQFKRTDASPSYSAFCGFEVDITRSGPLKAFLFYDQSGSRIIREIDTQPGFTYTLSSPQSGKSFSFPFGTAFRIEYPNGTTPGAPAVVTATGLMDKVPGIPAEAGTVTFGHATVLYLDPNGIPIVDFGPPTAI